MCDQAVLGFKHCASDFFVFIQLVQVSPVARVDVVQELCESRGGRPGLSVLMSLLVSVDVKIY